MSRVEYENLFGQVDDVLRRVERIELALHHLDARIESLEGAAGRINRPAK